MLIIHYTACTYITLNDKDSLSFIIFLNNQFKITDAEGGTLCVLIAVYMQCLTVILL